jgi:hypothetical protein
MIFDPGRTFQRGPGQLALLWGESNFVLGGYRRIFFGMGIIAGIDRLVPAACEPPRSQGRRGGALRGDRLQGLR